MDDNQAGARTLCHCHRNMKYVCRSIYFMIQYYYREDVNCDRKPPSGIWEAGPEMKAPVNKVIELFTLTFFLKSLVEYVCSIHIKLTFLPYSIILDEICRVIVLLNNISNFMEGHSLSEDGLLKTNSIFYINTQVVILGARRSLINHAAIFGI